MEIGQSCAHAPPSTGNPERAGLETFPPPRMTKPRWKIGRDGGRVVSSGRGEVQQNDRPVAAGDKVGAFHGLEGRLDLSEASLTRKL